MIRLSVPVFQFAEALVSNVVSTVSKDSPRVVVAFVPTEFDSVVFKTEPFIFSGSVISALIVKFGLIPSVHCVSINLSGIYCTFSCGSKVYPSRTQ